MDVARAWSRASAASTIRPSRSSGAGGEVAFGDEFGAAAELVAEAADEVGEPVGVAGVGDGAQQQVGEVGVLLDREEAGGLALVGVHLPLVAEEFGVEAEVAEVLVPAVVDLLPVHVQVRVRLAGLGEGVAEALHGAAPALRAGGALDGRPYGGGLGDGQRVEAEPGAGPEGVPGLGELPRVVGDLAAAPLADLADDDALAGERVLPLQGDVPAVVGEQELAQHAGAGAAEGVAVAGQHHREDQLEQDGLAAAVLQEEHAGRARGGAAGRPAPPRRTPPGWARGRARARRLRAGPARCRRSAHRRARWSRGGPGTARTWRRTLVVEWREVGRGRGVGAAVRSGTAGRRRRRAPGRRASCGGSSVARAVGDRDDAELQQLGHGGAARHVADLELVAGGGAVGAAGVVAGALEEAGVGEEGDGLADDAGGRTGQPARVLGGAGGAAPGVDPPGGLQAGRVGGRVGVLALLLGPLLQPAAGLPDEGVDAVDGDPADVAVVGEVLGAGEGHGGDGEMGEAVQEAVGGVGGGAAGVVAHADGEDGVLGGGHGHPGARGHLQDDQAEAGGDGVGEPGEGRVLAVAAQQLGVLGVAGGQQLGLQPEGRRAGPRRRRRRG